MRLRILVATTLMWAAVAAQPHRMFINVKESDFSRERLIKLTRQALRNSLAPFVQVTFFGEGGGPPLPKPSHYDFDHWRELFESSRVTGCRSPRQFR